MNESCSFHSCSNLPRFICSCGSYYCEHHFPFHSQLGNIHTLSRLYRVVDPKITKDLVNQIKAKINALESLRLTIQSDTAKIIQEIIQSLKHWESKIISKIKYLNFLSNQLRAFNLILMEDPENILESIGSVYMISNPTEASPVSTYSDYLDAFKLTTFPTRELNSNFVIESKLKILEEHNMFIEGHSHPVTSIVISADEQLIATGSADKTVRLWNSNSLMMQNSILRGHKNTVLCLAFASNSKLLASGSADQSIILWSLTSAPKKLTLIDHSGEALSLSFTSDASLLISTSSDKSIYIWNVYSSNLLTKLSGHNKRVTCSVITSNSQCIISGSEDKKIIIWSLFSSSKAQTLSSHKGPISFLLLTRENTHFISGSEDKRLILWNYTTKVQERIITTASELLHGSLSGNAIIFGCKDNQILQWDLQTFSELFPPILASGSIFAVAGSPSLGRIYCGTEGSLFSVIDWASHECCSAAVHTHAVQCVAVSHCGRLFASGSLDNTVRVWNIAARRQHCVFRGHTDYVISVAFTPDTRFLISGAIDNSAKVWDLEEKRLFIELNTYNSSVCRIVMTEDQTFVFAGSEDKIVFVWKLSDFSEQAKIETLMELARWEEKYEEIKENGFRNLF
jgi:WD40 repeat protein